MQLNNSTGRLARSVLEKSEIYRYPQTSLFHLCPQWIVALTFEDEEIKCIPVQAALLALKCAPDLFYPRAVPPCVRETQRCHIGWTRAAFPHFGTRWQLFD